MVRKIDLNKLIILDIETLINCITVFCIDHATGKEKEFIIFDHSRYENQAFELFKFLRSCARNGYSMITFNGAFFDGPVLHFFYDWCLEKQDPLYELQTKFIIDELYNKSQDIINNQEDQYKNYISDDDLFIPNIDLYQQKHFNRKKCSLKWVEFTMRSPDIQEMPMPHDVPITIDQIDDLITYNKNDVINTHEFFKIIKFETDLRLALSKEYNRNLINAAEPRLGREIFGTILAPKMEISYSELKKMRTIRKEVAFKDIILPYVKFHTPELQKVLTDLNQIVVNTLPNYKGKDAAFKYDFIYNGIEVFLGLGGIHACTKPGIYTPTNEEVCKDSDGKSYYPNICIQNKLKPGHFKGDTFIEVFGGLYEQRKVIPKADPKNYVYKIILNSVFGLSKEVNSYFYDPKLTYGITINGQLMLLMFVEALYTSVPDVKVLQMNTDGISYIYNKKHQPIVDKIWEWWQKLTGIELEHADYSKMIILDVNNYAAIDLKGKVKKKGRLDTEVANGKTNFDYNRNPSHLIVPIALESFFINGTPIEETIYNHNNIYDFCGGIKQTSDFTLNLYKHIGTTEIIEPQQKVTRYFASKNGKESGLLIKDYNNGNKVGYMVGVPVETLNTVNIPEAKHYNINYDWYIKQARDIVEQVQPKITQTTLF